MSHRSENSTELAAPPARIAAFAALALVLGIGVARLLDRPAGPECLGYLQVRSTSIVAPTAGTIASVTVTPGASIPAGATLVALRDENFEQSLQAARSRVGALEAELSRSQAQASLELQWRLRTLEAEICEVRLRSAGYLKEKFDFELQRNMLDDLLKQPSVAALDLPGSLVKEALETPRVSESQRMAKLLQMEVAQNAAEVSSAQVDICDAREKELHQLKEQLPRQIDRTMGVDVALGELEQARQTLALLESRQSELALTSPSPGKVGLLRVRAGDMVEAGEEILEILDEARREVIVHVPSRAITRYAPGTKLVLDFPGNVQRTGKVTAVAPQAESEEQIAGDPAILVRVEQIEAVWPSVPVGSQVRIHPAR